MATALQPLQPLSTAVPQAAQAAGGGLPWWAWLVIPIVLVAVILIAYKFIKGVNPPGLGSATKERWEERVKLTLQMHTPGLETVTMSGSSRCPPKRLGWAFGPLFDREYEYVGFTKGLFPLDRFPIGFINRFFRRPFKLPLFGWVVKPYLIRGKPSRMELNAKTNVMEYVQGDFGLAGRSIMVFGDGWDTFQDDLYLVPNWSQITGAQSIQMLQQDAILKADRTLCDQYRDRVDTLAKTSDEYFRSKWDRSRTVPVQQQQPQYMPPSNPPGQ